MSSRGTGEFILPARPTVPRIAENGLNWCGIAEAHPSGAKAHFDFAAFTPGLKSRPTARTSFSASCKVVPFQNYAGSRVFQHGAKLCPFKTVLLSAACLPMLLAALPACGQYPGQVTKNSKESPELRAISVLEWTGDAGKPKTSRLVPVAVLDDGKLEDGGIYMARPEPLSLAGEVEYELEQDGKPIGLFDIRNSGQEQGSWVGYGTWKPMPVTRPRPPAQTRIDDDAQGDEPVLHRKHHADEPNGGAGKSSSGSDSGTSGQAQADPDRPTLHKKTSSDSSGDASSGTTQAGTSPAQASDSDRPTLHKSTPSNDSTGSDSGIASAPADDPDRPVLKKPKKKQPEDTGHVDSLPETDDPDRPRLKRGKSDGGNPDVVPSMMGLPADLQQAVAVSDAKSHPAHPWDYAWSNPDDEATMKSALEDIARKALGLNAPPPKATPKRTAALNTTRKSAKPAPPPVPLADERFRVFELAYGSGATLVLTAHTDGPLAQQKFVTLIAQPDLYGNVLVLLKSVTDGAHLDDIPRMRLVDAVDAMADNRGELLFELRGATQRQFALYRVLRGQADKLFVSGGGEFGTESSE
jgi:hypothetical protein